MAVCEGLHPLPHFGISAERLDAFDWDFVSENWAEVAHGSVDAWPRVEP